MKIHNHDQNKKKERQGIPSHQTTRLLLTFDLYMNQRAKLIQVKECVCECVCLCQRSGRVKDWEGKNIKESQIQMNGIKNVKFL